MASQRRSQPPATVTRVVVGGVRGLLIELPLDELQLPDSLTASEREVVGLVAQGLSNEEIGRSRGRSARTVANQLAAVYRKLGVFSRTELLAQLNNVGSDA